MDAKPKKKRKLVFVASPLMNLVMTRDTVCLNTTRDRKAASSHRTPVSGTRGFRVLIGNSGTMHFNAYSEQYNHAHSLHVYF